MHSSRMRTARSSSRRRGVSTPGTPPGPDHLPLNPPGTSRPPWNQVPPRAGTPRDQTPLWEQALPLGAGTPPCEQNHRHL